MRCSWTFCEGIKIEGNFFCCTHLNCNLKPSKARQNLRWPGYLVVRIADWEESATLLRGTWEVSRRRHRECVTNCQQSERMRRTFKDILSWRDNAWESHELFAEFSSFVQILSLRSYCQRWHCFKIPQCSGSLSTQDLLLQSTDRLRADFAVNAKS